MFVCEERHRRLLHIVRLISSNQLRSTDPRIRCVLERLNSSGAPPSTPELAASVNLSPSRFRHLFRDEVGMSLGQYLKLSKLTKAKELMEHSFLEVKEVVAISGLKDLSHAVRDFKRTFGVTPLQARRMGVSSSTSDDGQKRQSSASSANGQQSALANRQTG